VRLMMMPEILENWNEELRRRSSQNREVPKGRVADGKGLETPTSGL